MALIALTSGKFAVVDADDYNLVKGLRWYATKSSCNWYARVNTKNGTLYMHRFIMNVKDSREVHHTDGDGLNNQRWNLEVCTRPENLSKRRYKHGGKK